MSAWLALVVVDAIAVASLARCFTGPGELAVALVTLVAVHLCTFAGSARRPRRSTADVPASGAPAPDETGRGAVRRLWWVVGGAVAVVVPVVWLYPGSLTALLPLHATWHAVDRSLAAAWPVYQHQLAPVAEDRGLVVACGWTAGALALVASALAADRWFPRVVVLIPAVGLFLFASTLGTTGWRIPALGAEAGAAVWFLAASAAESDSQLDVVVASSNGLPVGGARAARRSAASIARLALLAAAAAAIVGPNLPGARSAALVAWRGTKLAAHGNSDELLGSVGPGVQVSTLVQVAQQEINDTTTLLFTVHSPVVTREVIATLDTFNGERWTSSAGLDGSADRPISVPSFQTDIERDLVHPPAPIPFEGSSSETVTQAIKVFSLGGFVLPVPTGVSAVSGAGLVSRVGTGGEVVSTTELRDGAAYAVETVHDDLDASQLAADSAAEPIGQPQPGIQPDLALPGPIPAVLVSLAHSIVAGATTPFQEASDLQAYFLSGRFHYQLPGRTASGSVAIPSAGYGALVRFIEDTRTGYCQQFATAFAVLARIDGLPTRIAVGFLPGPSIGKDAWAVTGAQTHAWPQVQLAGVGWIDFEPTPGSNTVSLPTAPTVPTIPTTAKAHAGHHHALSAGHLGHAPTGGGATAPPRAATHHRPPTGGPQVPVLQLLLLLAAAWVVAVPTWRAVRRRRTGRDTRRWVLAAWRDASSTLDLAGIHRRRAETYLELARRVNTAGVLSADGEQALGRLAELATVACYSASPPPEPALHEAATAARAVRRGARRSVSAWRRALASLDPRSLTAA